MSNKYLDFNGLSYYNSIISPPLVSLINYNSKNVLNNTAHTYINPNAITFTVNDDKSVTFSGSAANANQALRLVGSPDVATYETAIPIPKGIYTISPTGINNNKVQYALGLFESSSDTRHMTYLINQEYTFEVTNDTTRYDFTLLILKPAVIETALTVYPMICTQENYKIDKTYVPYKPIFEGSLSNSDIDELWS